MKTVSLALPLLLLAADQGRAHLKAGSLTPKGGETLKIGDKVSITWLQETAHDGKYDLYYSKNGGSAWVEFEEGWQGPTTDGSTPTYQWTVPAGAAGTTTKLRVCQMAGGHCTSSTYTLMSGNFTVNTTGAGIQEAASLNRTFLRFEAARGTVEASFEMEAEGKVLVQAFDAQGREVARIFEGTRGAGLQRLSLHSEALAKAQGPLTVRLTAGSRTYNEYWNGSN